MRISDWSSDVCSSDLGTYFNWNSRCASCHSTNLRKNYDAKADRYDTRWSEINVACESCHGPGAKHLVWAKSTNKDDDPGRGLSVSLTNTAQWKFVAAQPPLSDIKRRVRSEEHTSELQSLMRISFASFCLK